MGTLVLLDLLGGVALLLWGLHMVQSGILRAFGPDLRRVLGKALGNRFTAFAGGLGLTALLQSSTATGLMTASFSAEGAIALVPALAIMLGANTEVTPERIAAMRGELGLDRPAIEHARAGPRHGKGGEEQRVGQIDADIVGRRAVQPEQDDGSGADEMGKTPPGDGANRHVLSPREQQQQSEDCFHVDRDQKQRIDVEVHRRKRPVNARGPALRAPRHN